MKDRPAPKLPDGVWDSVHNYILVALIYLLALQSPLEGISGIFKYIDEFVAVAGLLCWGISSIHHGRFRIKHYVFAAVIPLTVFLLAGFAGNILYRYQPWSFVLKDLFTNFKFFMALLTGYALMPKCMNKAAMRHIGIHLRLITALLFAVFCIERVSPVFGETEVRYGLRSAQMFYYHATYLAGSMAFLITAMTVFYDKRNLPFIGMTLLMLMFTLRSKAIVSAMVYVMLFMFLIVIKGKLKLWHFAVLGAAALVIGWEQISFYFIDLGGASGRSIMTSTSFQIMKDYFPIGTGFGTYGSAAAAENYSPVYMLYGFNDIHELASWNPMAFLNDTFWPIIIGQTGLIGTFAYLVLLVLVLTKVIPLARINRYCFLGGLFILVYLLISSTAEPAFNNAVAIPLAVILGGLIRFMEQNKYPNGCKATHIVLQ